MGRVVPYPEQKTPAVKYTEKIINIKTVHRWGSCKKGK